MRDVFTTTTSRHSQRNTTTQGEYAPLTLVHSTQCSRSRPYRGLDYGAHELEQRPRKSIKCAVCACGPVAHHPIGTWGVRGRSLNSVFEKCALAGLNARERKCTICESETRCRFSACMLGNTTCPNVCTRKNGREEGMDQYGCTERSQCIGIEYVDEGQGIKESLA